MRFCLIQRIPIFVTGKFNLVLRYGHSNPINWRLATESQNKLLRINLPNQNLFIMSISRKKDTSKSVYIMSKHIYMYILYVYYTNNIHINHIFD